MNLRNLGDWAKTFKDSRVQDKALAGDFLSAETSVLVSGPKTISGINTVDLIPIGLVQNFSVNQGKQIFTYNEIGSSIPFMIPGRVRTSASISRVLFDGPSLMYVLNLSEIDISSGKGIIDGIPANVGGPNQSAEADLPTSPWTAPTGGVLPGLPDTAKTGDLMVNLRSSFFNKPIGLGVVMYDNESQAYGGFYLEQCYINGHNMSLASQSIVIMENISMFATNIVPLSEATFETSVTP